MINYRIEELSPRDFEKLCIDLLNAEYGLSFKSFSEGPDSGIDGIISDSHRKIILQCKRYKCFRDLKRELKSEIKKVIDLNPTEYWLLSSCKITYKNESEIRNIFSLSEDTLHIYGYDDLQTLCRRHKQVLCLYSELFGFDINELNLIELEKINQYSLYRKRIEDIQKTFIKTKHYYDSLDLLSKSNVCLISGNPGVGKTSLSYYLLSDYIEKHYKPVILHKLSDIKPFLELSGNYIFYVDDFLGSVKLELEKDHEDREILSIISAFALKDNIKLILSTRENILTSANIRFEGISRIEFNKIHIILDKLTKSNKADIFYSIINNSPYDKAHKLELLIQDRYKTIVEHSNYNPRLIETLLNRKFYKYL